MKIALVASLVAPIRPAEANGPHSVIIDLAHGLTERGHQAVIYAAPGSVADGLRVTQIDVEPAAREAAVRTDGTTSVTAQQALRRGFDRLYARLRRDAPDVVSQHAYDAAAIELAEGLPVLHTLHLPPMGDVVGAARTTKAPLAAVSEAARRTWRDAGVTVGRVLRNGVPRRGVPEGPILPTVLVAGRVSPEKGTHVAIRVARRSGLAPLIVGDIYDADYHARHVQPLLRPGEYVGPVTRAQLSRLMARSSLLLMPIRWEEPFGLVAAEAQMAGCPVVAYRRGALPEVVRDGVGGFLAQPDDEDELLEACRMALTLDRSSIRSYADRHLSADAMVDAYEAALSEVSRPPVSGQGTSLQRRAQPAGQLV